MYTFPISEHLEIFLLSLGMGFLLGVLYDVLRVIRLVVSRGKAAVYCFDIIFIALAAVLSYLFMLAVNMGAVRAYIVIAELMGFICYYLSFGVFVVRLCDKLAELIRRFFTAVGRAVKKPLSAILGFLRRIFGRIKVRIRKKSQNNKKTLKKLLHIHKLSLYNLHGIFSSFKKTGK